MEVFHFKKFDVANEKSAMKVNTDGVLLGALVSLPDKGAGDATCDRSEAISVLDVGTGTGTIALMLAQRLENQDNINIIGIDIDPLSASEACTNFRDSPWSSSMEAIWIPLQKRGGEYNLIVSNPPYYDDSLQNPDVRKNTARHATTVDSENNDDAPLSYRTLLDFACRHLKTGGHIAMIMPADCEKALLRYGRGCGLFPFRVVRIRTVEKKPFSRIVVELSKNRSDIREETLTIHHGTGYSNDYQCLMHDFYLWA